MTNTITLGSISHGTLRHQDLIPTFISTLQKYGVDPYDELSTEAKSSSTFFDDHDYWNSEQSTWDLEELITKLESLANTVENTPMCLYFGTHEGDGSDFGFWFDEEQFDNAVDGGLIVHKPSSWVANHDELVELGKTYSCLAIGEKDGVLALYDLEDYSEIWNYLL